MAPLVTEVVDEFKFTSLPWKEVLDRGDPFVDQVELALKSRTTTCQLVYDRTGPSSRANGSRRLSVAIGLR